VLANKKKVGGPTRYWWQKYGRSFKRIRKICRVGRKKCREEREENSVITPKKEKFDTSLLMRRG